MRDLLECHNAHMSLLVPNQVSDPVRPVADGILVHLPAGGHLAGGIDATPNQLLAFLDELDVSPEVSHLGTASLATLT